MTCFVFASRTVRLAEEIKKGNDSREEEEEEDEEEEEEEGEEGEESEEEVEERKERRDRGQSSSHGVRSAERLIFFHPFSFLPPVPPVGPSVSLAPSVPVEKVAACTLFIFLPAFRPFSPPIVHPTSRFPSSFSPGSPRTPSPASRACTRPFFCRILFVPSFVAAFRDAGAGAVFRAVSSAQMEEETLQNTSPSPPPPRPTPGITASAKSCG